MVAVVSIRIKAPGVRSVTEARSEIGTAISLRAFGPTMNRLDFNDGHIQRFVTDYKRGAAFQGAGGGDLSVFTVNGRIVKFGSFQDESARGFLVGLRSTESVQRVMKNL